MDSWWKEAVFYHVYLRSFQDSNGDGIGDLKGLINRLDYIANLGADAIWVSPFYESPHVDFGYDISNHKAVDPRYGTLEDFEILTKEANKRGLKIVVDIILNHTSDEHPLFQESRKSRDSEKEIGSFGAIQNQMEVPPITGKDLSVQVGLLMKKLNNIIITFIIHNNQISTGEILKWLKK